KALGAGLGQAADYLEDRVAPAATKAADNLDKSTDALAADARRLADLVNSVPRDARPLEAVVAGLGEFEEGLARVEKVLEVEDFEAIREGFTGLDEALTGGAKQVDRMAKAPMPSVTVVGFLPRVEQKPLWPDAKATADGMRKAAKGVVAAGAALDELNKDLPQ